MPGAVHGLRGTIVQGLDDFYSQGRGYNRGLAARAARAFEELNQDTLVNLYKSARRHLGTRVTPWQFGWMLGELTASPREARLLPFEIRVPSRHWELRP